MCGQRCVCSTTPICSPAYPGKEHHEGRWLMNSFSKGLHQQAPPETTCALLAACMSINGFLEVPGPRT